MVIAEVTYEAAADIVGGEEAIRVRPQLNPTVDGARHRMRQKELLVRVELERPFELPLVRRIGRRSSGLNRKMSS
jgi:hypothetical protein